jgi:methyl-accepting chemotaxis protein
LLVFVIGLNLLLNKILVPIEQVRVSLKELSLGRLSEKLDDRRKDEIGRINLQLNKLIDRISKSSKFALEVGKGNFDEEFEAYGREDILGNSLLTMRRNLKKAAEEEEIRNWMAKGDTLLSGIMREHSNNLDVLCDQFLYKLTNYISAQQGLLFIRKQGVEGDVTEDYLELAACFALERKKYLHKKIFKGDGLVGQAWQERDTLFINDVPQNYSNIITGVGILRPKSILMVPIVLNENTYGVIELAFVADAPAYVVTFVEEIATAFAAVLSNSLFNERNKKLLEQSQQMTENLRSQEEEMRQNFEELQSTQEELQRRERVNQEKMAVMRQKLSMAQQQAE